MDEISKRRNIPILTMAIVRKLTDLTDRQIRYYTDNGLVQVARSESGQRLFTLKQIDQLLEIKSQLSAGFTLAETKEFFEREAKKKPAVKMNDERARELLYDELLRSSPFSQK